MDDYLTASEVRNLVDKIESWEPVFKKIGGGSTEYQGLVGENIKITVMQSDFPANGLCVYLDGIQVSDRSWDYISKRPETKEIFDIASSNYGRRKSTEESNKRLAKLKNLEVYNR